ncbi:MAG: hypothetical protein QXY55_01245 [Candidatus Korarchaeota archaeon]|nr:hypothetical protein [Thermoproteota archaeon]
MFLILAQVLMTAIISYIALKKHASIQSEAFLVGLMMLGLLYIIRMNPFTPAEEYFLAIAAAFILPVVILIVIFITFATGRVEIKVVNNKTYIDEVKRKTFHLIALALFVPKHLYRQIYNFVIDGTYATFGIFITKRDEGFLCLLLFAVALALLMLFTFIEFLRLNYKPAIFGVLLREKELNQLASYLYSAAAVYLVALLFFPHDDIVAAAIAIAFLADLAACIIGKKCRRIALNDRSLEGFLANFITGSLAGYLIVGWIAIPASLIVAILDFINGASRIAINDNILFPLLAALSLSLMTSL